MSVSKAMFLPDGGAPLIVQYNPVNFKFDKPVSWKEHDENGQESKLEFQKVQPATISMELTFDTTNDGSDVRQAWVNTLLAMTNPTVPDGGDTNKMRPPIVDFEWGSFAFSGVLESVNATYNMFSQDGAPIRAKVTVKMKEWTARNDYAAGSGGEGLSTEKVQLVTVQANQTVSQIAAAFNITMSAILDSNPQISDPMEIEAGMSLMIYHGF